MKNSKTIIENLALAVGILANGKGDADLFVHDAKFYDAVLRKGSLGLGESYMAGWWDSACLDTLLYKMIRAGLQQRAGNTQPSWIDHLKEKLINLQSVTRAREVAKKHYNLGNELFEVMLDSYMQYSCAYWDNAQNLEQAQLNKMELICKKLKLVEGQQLLDIGCGWGGFARYASENYGVHVTGITISYPQAKFAERYCSGLPVEIKLQDYRKLSGSFDRIVSVGMFEHVGYKNYKVFMEVARRCLKGEGLFLLHCIGGNYTTTRTDQWINRYIFPNGMLPSIEQIGAAIAGRFILQDWQNLGPHYDKTIMHWLTNFKENWSKIKGKYDGRFYRMWEYYLSLSAASFRARSNQLWQLVLTTEQFQDEYIRVAQ
ncbi:cyclopropane fatty acyl phospholipid synthase [Sphingobacterium faecium]|uniref:cyclopropane fatty acyl phospholipid synthase n=1 Tax=Sphingobacterium faecium TaxID=34087 RepID=UPI0032091080